MKIERLESKCVVCGMLLLSQRRFVRTGEIRVGGVTEGYYQVTIWCDRCGLEYRQEPWATAGEGGE